MITLVVEDESLLLLMLQEEFEAVGLEVAVASSAYQALELLGTTQASDLAVLITDLNLGPGMNGIALAAEARRRYPDVRVIYATGNASWLAEQVEAFQPGDLLFTKPYDLARLVDAVRAAAQDNGSVQR